MPPIYESRKPIVTYFNETRAAQHVLESLPIITKMENTAAIPSSKWFWCDPLVSIFNGVPSILKELAMFRRAFAGVILLTLNFYFVTIAVNFIADFIFVMFPRQLRPLIPSLFLSSSTASSELQHLQGQTQRTSLSYYDVNISRQHQINFTLSLLDHNPFSDELLELQQTCGTMQDRSTVVTTAFEQPHLLNRECLKNLLFNSTYTEHRCPICRSGLVP